MINMRNSVVIKHYTGGTWVNSTDGILDISIVRGIPQYVGCWSQVEPGQLQLRSRDLSLVDLALQTRIRIEIGGTAVFTGKVFDINTEYIPKDDSIVTITAFDELGVLSLKKYQHQTVIGGDYQPREIASFGTLPSILTASSQPNADWNNVEMQGKYVYAYTGIGYPILNTTYGVSGFNPAAPAPGASSDSTWGTYLNSPAYDVDGGVICNPRNSIKGFGVPVMNSQSSATQTGMEAELIGRDNIEYGNSIFQTAAGSKSRVTDPGHPLYGDYGFYKEYYKRQYISDFAGADWAALITTNDTDALTLFLKAEQAEAGFAFVDAKNRFRLYSRAVVDNDTYISEARFASDGSGISYNNINVTNGWESVVNGVTVNNTWSNDFIDSDQMVAWVDNDNDGSITGYYQNAQYGNRNYTTGTVKLNESADIVLDPAKEYDWLGYNVTEQKQRYLRYCKLNNNTMPIYKFDTRDFSLNKLTTTSYFEGTTGLGSKQLSLDTNYAFPINSGPGYLWNRAGTLKPINRTTVSDRDYNVAQRQSELANFIITNYANPVKDIRSISFSVHPDDLDTIPYLEIFDRIDIDHNDDGLVIDKQYAIMGISHYITPNTWDVTYQLWNQEGRP